ncbi:MAG: YscO family type III secretion system apparatus protein [Rubrivivax sp.]|nr:YscO family type III secretion system apparatus protein [Rubrivivax sp.]
MWRELQQLKAFREGQARTQLQASRTELALARQQREAAAATVLKHRADAQARERALYGELMARVVRLADIEDVQHVVAWLRQQEQQLVQREQEARAAEQQREQQLQQATERHKTAERVLEKFTQLARIHFDEAAREAERQEDLELEEVASLRRDREDWDRQEAP